MIISDIANGERIDKFLAGRISTQSRSAIQQYIVNGNVTVNGQPVNKHYVLKSTDTVTVPDILLHQPASFVVQANPDVVVDIVAATPEYCIVNKPAGMIMHPGDAHLVNDTLVNGLLAHFPEIAAVGNDPLRPGIVQRLDKDVSGIMVVARTSVMYDELRRQFKARSIIKKYIALVHGVLTEPHGTITLSISRSTRERTKMAAHPDNSGKSAYTEYSVIQQFQHYALLAVQIYTGRTHQIRVHCNAIGHPIVGDMTYKPKKLKSRLLVDRIFLHAEQLSFMDHNGQAVTYSAPLPQSLQDIIDDLYTTM